MEVELIFHENKHLKWVEFSTFKKKHNFSFIDFQSLPTQNIYREKLVEHPIIYLLSYSLTMVLLQFVPYFLVLSFIQFESLDLIGNYLFCNSNFLERFVTNNPATT
jgi:hypothetical protein